MKRIHNLCKVETYRYFHSMSIIKYNIFIPMILLFISYINIVCSGSEVTEKLVWASMAPDFLYLLALICTVTAVYVGREFFQKTIRHEIMSGYGFCEIAFAKTITCGVMTAAIIEMCMLIYLGILLPTFCKDFLMRILLLFVLFIHLCSVTTLYVLLCRNSVVGGCLSFARFLLTDAALQIAVSGPATGHREVLLIKWMVFNQWHELINIESPLSREVIVGIAAAAIIEYGILQGILLWRFRISDV